MTYAGRHHGSQRRPAPGLEAEARALASAVRLRILRLCLDGALTNKEIARRLGVNPATTLHHVRTLVDTGFLAAQPVRRGTRGAREVPYLATRKSWTLDVAESGVTGGRAAMLEAFLQEVRLVDAESRLRPARAAAVRCGLGGAAYPRLANCSTSTPTGRRRRTAGPTRSSWPSTRTPPATERPVHAVDVGAALRGLPGLSRRDRRDHPPGTRGSVQRGPDNYPGHGREDVRTAPSALVKGDPIDSGPRRHVLPQRASCAGRSATRQELRNLDFHRAPNVNYTVLRRSTEAGLTHRPLLCVHSRRPCREKLSRAGRPRAPPAATA